MNIIISDFDDTLFRRNYGVLQNTVDYLKERSLPIAIVTFRADNQRMFIEQTLDSTGLEVIGYGFAGSRVKDPRTKLPLIKHFASKYNVVEYLDDDAAVCKYVHAMGIQVRLIKE